jgi:attachment p12 family protein
MQISETTQQIIVGIIVAAAVISIIRLRWKSSKSRTGSCSNCDIEH